MAHAPTVIRLEFDRVRKLKPRHRYIRDAVRASGKSVTELVADPFGGHPFLIQALVQPSANKGENISLDKASDLLDDYYDKNGTVEALRTALMEVLGAYLHIEMTPTEDEAEGDDVPNGDSPAQPGRSDD